MGEPKVPFEMASESTPHLPISAGTQPEAQFEVYNIESNANPVGVVFPSRPLEGEELRQALIERLEHVFSKEYLASDPILVSRLNADFFAPISLIEELPIIKNLTTDLKLINSAIRSSKAIVVDEEKLMAKPVFKLVQRNTVILRDIPEGTTEQDVRNLLQGTSYASSIEEAKPECGNTFFLRFNSEEVAQEAWKHLRNQTLGGKPVQARIKSENLLKSLYYNSSVSQQPTQFYQSNGLRPYSSTYTGSGYNYGRGDAGGNPAGGPPGGGRGYRNYDPTKPRQSQWNGSNNRKKEYRNKPFEGKGGRGRGSRYPKKGGHDKRMNVLPTAPAHWPPLSAADGTPLNPSDAGAQVAAGAASNTDTQVPVTNAPQVSQPAPADSTPSNGAKPKPEQAAAPTSASPAVAASTPSPAATTTAAPTTTTTPQSTTSPATPATQPAPGVWAVNNSAVKQPPPKKAPNTGPKRQKQKQQAPPQQQTNQASAGANTSGASAKEGGGKWKEATKKRTKKNAKRGSSNTNPLAKQESAATTAPQQAASTPSADSASHTSESSSVASQTAAPASANTVTPPTQQPAAPSPTTRKAAVPSSPPATKFSYADIVRPSSPVVSTPASD